MDSANTPVRRSSMVDWLAKGSQLGRCLLTMCINFNENKEYVASFCGEKPLML